MALVEVAIADGVARLTLSSPENRNALSTALISDLTAGIHAANRAPEARVLLLDHAGSVFCAGIDLKETASSGATAMPVAELPGLLTALWRSPKPVLARIGGPARAGGLGLIAACDMAVCADEATFAFSEVRIGAIPASISPIVLPRLTARAASELYLTGAVFDGRRAEQIGLVTKSVPGAELDHTITSYLEQLLAAGPNALIGAKQLLHRGFAADPLADLTELAAISAQQFQSAEAREGIAAFAERRPPSWVLT